jgi:hypothetical protein
MRLNHGIEQRWLNLIDPAVRIPDRYQLPKFESAHIQSPVSLLIYIKTYVMDFTISKSKNGPFAARKLNLWLFETYPN